MRRISFSTGGFPLTTGRLEDIQSCWEAVERRLGVLAGAGESYVISGCGSTLYVDGEAVGKSGDAAGWVHLDDGHVYEHVGGLRGGSQLSVIEETVSSVGYEDGESHPFVTRRYCTTTGPCAVGTAYGGGSVVYSVDWVDVRLDVAGYDHVRVVSELLGKADESSVASRIAELERQDGLLRGAIDALSGDTDGGFSALQRHLVPRGTVVMWGQATPDYAVSLSEIKGGYSAGERSDWYGSRGAAAGLPWGWLPCHDVYSTSAFGSEEFEAVRGAWQAYVDELGLRGTVRKREWDNGEMLDITGALGLPNLSGLFPLGSGHMGNVANALRCGSVFYEYGARGGEGRHTLTEGEMPRHRHGLSVTSDSVKHDGAAERHPNETGGQTSMTSYAGGGEAHNNMPPYMVVNWLIKVV